MSGLKTHRRWSLGDVPTPALCGHPRARLFIGLNDAPPPHVDMCSSCRQFTRRGRLTEIRHKAVLDAIRDMVAVHHTEIRTHYEQRYDALYPEEARVLDALAGLKTDGWYGGRHGFLVEIDTTLLRDGQHTKEE